MRFSRVHCWYTSSLRHTVLSPGALVKRHRKRFSSCTTHTSFTLANGHAALHSIIAGTEVTIPGTLIRASLFTDPLVPCDVSPDENASISQVRFLSERATRVLWHQRLRHVRMRCLAGLYKHVDVIPAIKLPPGVEACDTCWSCKLRNATRGTGDTRKDNTVPGQDISLDFGFIVQRSKDMACFEKFMGLNGETAYLPLSDHKSDMLFGIATIGKSPPLSWLNRWLAQYRPSDVSFRYACMDGGGELSNNGEVQKLLAHHGYAIIPTSPASSFQNAPGERPHQDIGAAL
jgi:hypothetical protein